MITHGLGWIQLALNFFETDVAVSSGLNPERSASRAHHFALALQHRQRLPVQYDVDHNLCQNCTGR